jgi:pyruvate kinase
MTHKLPSSLLNKILLDRDIRTNFEIISSAVSAVHAAYHVGAAAIVTITTSGKTAELLAKYRPQCPTVAVTR